jgi:hypothetical protein
MKSSDLQAELSIAEGFESGGFILGVIRGITGEI